MQDRKHIIKNIIINVILFIVVSFWEFVYLELFFKKQALSFPVGIIIKNVILIMVVNLILLCIFHRMKIAFIISCTLFLLAGIANFLLYHSGGMALYLWIFMQSRLLLVWQENTSTI